MTGERLKALRKNLGLSQVELGQVLKINASAISQMENNIIRPSLDTLFLLSKHYGVNLHWLITGNGTMYGALQGAENGQTTQRLEKIKSFLTSELTELLRSKEEMLQSESFDLGVSGEIAAGPPVEAVDSQLDVVSVRRSMINGVIDDYICLRVNGHSMEPMVLHNDVVIIRKGQNWEKLAGLICAVRLDGAITLKRLSLDPKRKLIVLFSVNEEYQPILINPSEHEDITLIGSLYYLYRKLQ